MWHSGKTENFLIVIGGIVSMDRYNKDTVEINEKDEINELQLIMDIAYAGIEHGSDGQGSYDSAPEMVENAINSWLLYKGLDSKYRFVFLSFPTGNGSKMRISSNGSIIAIIPKNFGGMFVTAEEAVIIR